MYNKMKNKETRLNKKDIFLPIGIVLIGAAIFFSPLVDDIINEIERIQLENKLENEYEIVDYNFQTSEEIIEFTGYEGFPCTNYLEPNVQGMQFRYYPTGLYTDPWKEVGYKYNGKLYIAKYIKEYASKDEVMKYISTCDNELSENVEKKRKNKQSW